MRLVPFISVAALMALAACGQSTPPAGGNETGNMASDAGVETTAPGAAPAADASMAATPTTAEGFVTAAAISDMYEIEAGRLAQEKARSSDVRAFGEMMVADHTTTTERLKSTLASASLPVTPPTAMDPRRQGMIDALRSASAEDFDRTYMTQQLAAHQEALSLMQGYGRDGDTPALKTLATETAPKIEQHLQEAQRLATAAGG